MKAAVSKDVGGHETLQCIKRLRSRLERWELPHLRELAARLASELEDAQARAYMAGQSAEFWQSHAEELREELRMAKPEVSFGMTVDGSMGFMAAQNGHSAPLNGLRGAQ